MILPRLALLSPPATEGKDVPPPLRLVRRHSAQPYRLVGRQVNRIAFINPMVMQNIVQSTGQLLMRMQVERKPLRGTVTKANY